MPGMGTKFLLHSLLKIDLVGSSWIPKRLMKIARLINSEGYQLVIRERTLIWNPPATNHRPIHVKERNVNYSFPNTISKSRYVTNIMSIKNNKIQNRLTPGIYVSITWALASQSKARGQKEGVINKSNLVRVPAEIQFLTFSLLLPDLSIKANWMVSAQASLYFVRSTPYFLDKGLGIVSTPFPLSIEEGTPSPSRNLLYFSRNF